MTHADPPRATGPLGFEFSSRRVTRFFVAAIALLTLLSVAEQYVIHQLGRADLEEYLIAFDVDAESNLPTWYASFTLLVASLLMGVFAAHARRNGLRDAGAWRALNVILAVLSVDEIAQLHEHLGRLHEAWHTSGLFYFAWVIPGTAAVLLAFAVFAPFLWRQPAPLRSRLLLAGVVYFVGALGVEALSGWRAETMGMNNMTHSLIATVEEDLEMTGVALLIVALVQHAERLGLELTLSGSVRNGASAGTATPRRAA